MTPHTHALPRSPKQPYFRDLNNHDLLNRQEERTLARRYQRKNDEAALRRLITGNLRLVVTIAKQFWIRSSVSLLDLIQEGNVGLIRAAKRFDPSKQVKFSYYASFWIKAHIYKYLMDNYRTVRVGTTQSQRKLFFNLRKTRNRLVREGIEPTPEAIAEEMNVSPREVEQMQMRLDQPDLSLNAPLYDHGRDVGEQVDRVRSPAPPADQRFEKRQLMALLNTHVRGFRRGRLDKREKAILDRRILAASPDTLQTLGERFGVSRERIRQVEKGIIEKLRKYLFTNMPDLHRWVTS